MFVTDNRRLWHHVQVFFTICEIFWRNPSGFTVSAYCLQLVDFDLRSSLIIRCTVVSSLLDRLMLFTGFLVLVVSVYVRSFIMQQRSGTRRWFSSCHNLTDWWQFCVHVCLWNSSRMCVCCSRVLVIIVRQLIFLSTCFSRVFNHIITLLTEINSTVIVCLSFVTDTLACSHCTDG